VKNGCHDNGLIVAPSLFLIATLSLSFSNTENSPSRAINHIWCRVTCAFVKTSMKTTEAFIAYRQLICEISCWRFY